MRKLLIGALTTLVLLTGVALPAAAQSTSLIPANGGYLGSAFLNSAGDEDGINVIFFQIPDTTTGSLYFDIYSPGCNSNNNSGDTGNGTGTPIQTTTFTLIGGSGAYTGPNSRAINFALAGLGGDAAYQGTQLDSMSFTTSSAAAWVPFAGVSPSQGEHVGNYYYFKVVADANGPQSYASSAYPVPGGVLNRNGALVYSNPVNYNNSYRLDVSTTGGSGTPTGISGARSFSYNWCVNIYNPGTPGPYPQWDLYPFVPDTAATTDWVQMFDWDADQTETWSVSNRTTLLQGNVTYSAGGPISINNAWAHFANQVGSASQTYGTWDLTILANNAGTGINGMSLVTVLNPTPPGDTTAGGGGPAGTATVLPTYSTPYNPPAPDHVTVSPATATIAISPSNVTLAIQIVDSSGTPVPAIRSVYVVGTPVGATTPIINGGGTSATIATDLSGTATFTVADAGAETVNISLTTDGSNGSSSLPNTVANGSATVTVVSNPAPTISSTANATVTAGNGVTLPTINLADTGTADFTAANDIRIHMPPTLIANFDTTVLSGAQGLSLTVGGAGGGVVSGTVSYPDAQTVLINVTTNFGAANTLAIAGLKLTSTNSASSASLVVSYNGGSTYPTDYTVTDDKVITISNPPPTMSSASDTGVTTGSGVTLPNISIADSGTADITSGNDIRIHIPPALVANFDTTVLGAGQGLTLTVGGVGGGVVSGTVSYPDAKTVLINVTTSFGVANTLTVAGLKLTNANSSSRGAW